MNGMKVLHGGCFKRKKGIVFVVLCYKKILCYKKKRKHLIGGLLTVSEESMIMIMLAGNIVTGRKTWC